MASRLPKKNGGGISAEVSQQYNYAIIAGGSCLPFTATLLIVGSEV